MVFRRAAVKPLAAWVNIRAYALAHTERVQVRVCRATGGRGWVLGTCWQRPRRWRYRGDLRGLISYRPRWLGAAWGCQWVQLIYTRVVIDRDEEDTRAPSLIF
ncbi:hypothetical protein FKP32DRAFT_29340 [Trametes sanguinea]|nr:hypothetical protein FKP32DRAFT_29340 [Trametes sanguinea]